MSLDGGKDNNCVYANSLGEGGIDRLMRGNSILLTPQNVFVLLRDTAVRSLVKDTSVFERLLLFVANKGGDNGLAEIARVATGCVRMRFGIDPFANVVSERGLWKEVADLFINYTEEE